MDNSSLAYSEVCTILNMLEDEYKERVPKNVMDFFEEERDKEYNPIIDVNIPLEKQNLKRKTLVLLAILNLNYWCDSEEEKQEILDSFAKNEELKRLKEKELTENYNINNLFNKIENTENKTEVSLIEYKEQNFIQKIISKIKSLFRRKN
ncbi:MAG: hypothetical protein V8R74_00585 [Clostridia bacterium]